MILMSKHIRKFNKIPYFRTTGIINIRIARLLVKPIRKSGYRARIDVYKNAYAIWVRKHNDKLSINNGFIRRSDYINRYEKADISYLTGADWRTAKPTKSIVEVRLPLGTWRYDNKVRTGYGYSVEILKSFTPKRLIPSEGKIIKHKYVPEYEKESYIKQYKNWIRDGHFPPPIEVLQTKSGKLRIVDGHRRWAAALATNTRIRAWVSYNMIGDFGTPVALSVLLQ